MKYLLILFCLIFLYSTNLLSKDKLYVSLSQIDDIGSVLIINDKLEEVAKCQWSSGVHGSSSMNISDKIKRSKTNYVIFVVINKSWEGLFGGKSKWNLELTLNGSSIWSDSQTNQGDRSAGLRVFKAFRVTKDSNGNISVNDELTEKEEDSLDEIKSKLEEIDPGSAYLETISQLPAIMNLVKGLWNK